MVVREGFVYDIECLANTHTATFYSMISKEFKVFAINHLRDDRKEYFEFLFWCVDNAALCGFNNYMFDYQVLHIIMKNYKFLMKMSADDCAKKIKQYTNKIIEAETNAAIAWKPLIPQLDLYKVMHFDNKAKTCSLKQLEYAMEMDSIEEMPYPHDYNIQTLEELQNLIDYNIHDVVATEKFLGKIKETIKLRKDLTKEFGINMMNYNEPKIGAELFAYMLSKEMGVTMKELKNNRSLESEPVKFSDIISDKIKFTEENVAYNSLLEFLKKQVVIETKGYFKDMPLSNPDIKAYSAHAYPGSIISKKVVSKRSVKIVRYLENLNVWFKGFRVDIGQGGLHGCTSPGIYTENDMYEIIDVDVASFYANLAVNLAIKHKRLGDQFTKVYSFIYNRRKEIPKINILNKAYKAMLTGSFGKLGEKTSFLRDEAALLTITLNGQMYLLMLTDQLAAAGVDFKILQGNTDGKTYMVNREHKEKFMEICKKWEMDTNLELEYCYYTKMIIRDVNNYIGVYKAEEGKEAKKPKFKGFFELEKEWHKNRSMKIVQIALSNYLLKDIPIEETIKSHDNPFDFCKMAKAKSNFKIELWNYNKDGDKLVQKLHKITRYVVSNNGGQLMKVMPPTKTEKHTDTHKQKQINPNQSNLFDFVEDTTLVIRERESNLEAGYLCSVYNTIDRSKPIGDYKINYDYYINECKKVINALNAGQSFDIDEDEDQLELDF